MKKNAIIFLLLLLTVCTYAQQQKRTVYCQVSSVISENGLSQKALVLYNDSTYVIKDSKGKVALFKTYIAVLNYMAKYGWKLEPVQITHGGNAVFIMSKLVEKDSDALKGVLITPSNKK